MRGKALISKMQGLLGVDHPRVCGEKRLSFFQHCERVGSPPRMRGKANPLLAVLVSVGITPAYAGKSDKELLQLVIGQDHPRVCGEKPHGKIRMSA